jgi:hypothetical protein
LVKDGRVTNSPVDRAATLACLGRGPGADDDGHINAMITSRPVPRGHIWIGALCEYTRDVDDPRLDRTPAEKRRGLRANYVTVCQRLVDEARKRGLLIE